MLEVVVVVDDVSHDHWGHEAHGIAKSVDDPQDSPGQVTGDVYHGALLLNERLEVELVSEEEYPGVDEATESHGQGEQGHGEGRVSSAVGSTQQGQPGAQGRQRVGHLPDHRRPHQPAGDDPVHQDRARHGDQPHGEVGQAREEALEPRNTVKLLPTWPLPCS